MAVDSVGCDVTSDATGDALLVVSFIDDGGSTGIIVGDTSSNELTSTGDAMNALVKLTHRPNPSS